MERRAKVELFEEIRREYEFGIGTVRGVARKLGVHRRQVRQALADAQPPARKQPERRRPVHAGLMPFIEAILTTDRQAPTAKSYELRATMSLARLLAKQGRRDEARAMLAEIFNWFTEGFEFPDLRDAKTLLDQH